MSTAQADLFTDLSPRPSSTIRTAAFQRSSRTSREQARRVRPRVPKQRERVLVYLQSCGPTGSTMHGIAAGLGIPLSSVCPRLSELRDAGLAHDTDREEDTPHGGRAAVWIATEGSR